MSDEKPLFRAEISFTEQLVRLRSKAGLSQSRLAKLAQLRQQQIARWEAGDGLPQAPNLKRLIAALLAQRAFARGSEADEALALWEQANREGPRRLPFFDATWFAALLAQQFPTAPRPPPPVDWGALTDAIALVDRENELALLNRWLMDEGCRVVGIFGPGGIGKTVLAVHAARLSSERFDAVIVRSLRDAPLLGTLLDGLIRPLDPNNMSEHGLIETQLARLLAMLRERRCLLVLDDVEAIMQPGASLGQYLRGYEPYGRLIRQIGESTHQSSLMLIGRERPHDVWQLEQQVSVVRSLTLRGLPLAACHDLLLSARLHDVADNWRVLAERHRGNPLTLKLAAETVRSRFHGDLATFLAQAEALPEAIRSLLSVQIERASALEQQLLTWLAIEWEPASAQQLRERIACPVANPGLPQALEALRQRFLIERPRDGSFSLQPIVRAYMIELLVERVADQLIGGRLDLVCTYALAPGATKAHLRDTHMRLIVQPLLARLRAQIGSEQVISALLLECLDRLRALPPEQQCYGADNLTLLLSQAQGDLGGSGR